MLKSKKKKLEKAGWKVGTSDDFLNDISPKNKSVDIELDLSDDVLLKLFLESHKKDMKFNDFCNMILLEYINKERN